MKTYLIKKVKVKIVIVILVIICSIINFLKIKGDSKRWVDADVTVKLPFEINILSTGKSDFILIESEGKFVVIDCGFYENSEKIKEFLKFKGVEEIEYLILTHNDKDHIGGAPVILDNFKINKLVQADYEKNTVQYKNYIEAIERNSIEPILIHSNIVTNINGAKMTIYPAIKSRYDKSNDYCIIVGIDYGKYRYELARKEKEAKKKQKTIDVKEVRLSPNIDKNDLNTKINQARKFLSKGDKVKVTLRFRGRELAHVNSSKVILEEFAEQLSDVAVVDKQPKFEGRSMIMFLTEKR